MEEKLPKYLPVVGAIVSLLTSVIGYMTIVKKNDIEKHESTTLGYSLLFIGSVLLIVVIIYLIYIYKREKNKRVIIEGVLKNVTISIDGKPIMSINQENLNRTVQNDDFKLINTTNTVTIEGKDLDVEFDSKGVRVANNMAGYIYNISGDKFIPFTDLDCYGFDLLQDPNKAHDIKPVLLSQDGLSKQVLVPFLKSVPLQHPYHVYIYWKYPDCMQTGIDYYTCSLSYNDNSATTAQTVKLVFKKPFPKWVRVYEVEKGMTNQFKALQKHAQNEDCVTYMDEYPNINLKKIIIYLFER
ncbi:hypothetical protein [Mucilaginibacter sp. 44-25]|uniref:hypothetical protein n=1 Tax=Mucilaginibacter sp. 44-25 TaxID=1895794 RepID=UPI00095DB566|nr:hypothetical protein [Mucilaginibacter sp. 44-25]OJW12771.1 MAG: hypothetical protein BGO48_02500 [Mucilaginibacter sp. 44-25]